MVGVLQGELLGTVVGRLGHVAKKVEEFASILVREIVVALSLCLSGPGAWSQTSQFLTSDTKYHARLVGDGVNQAELFDCRAGSTKNRRNRCTTNQDFAGRNFGPKSPTVECGRLHA